MSDSTSGAIGGAAQGATAGTAIMPGVGTAVGAVLGGVIGLGMGAGVNSRKVAYDNVLNQYMGQLQAIDMPRYEDLKLTLERYQRGEQLTPEELSSLQDVDSEVSKLTQDKEAKNTQLNALAAMKARSRGGLTLQDKADLMTAQEQIDKQQSGVQKSILANMQARGQTGNGQEIALRMAANQQGTQQASSNALQVAAQSRNTALQALKESAVMGRQIGQDQMEFDKMKADATDSTRRSNLERQQATMRYNVGNRNTAQQGNVGRNNSIMDKNTFLDNQEQMANKQILVDDYDRQIGRLNMIYKQKLGQAKSKVTDAQNQMAGTLGAIGSVGDMFSGFGSSGGTSKVSQNPELKASNDIKEWKGT